MKFSWTVYSFSLGLGLIYASQLVCADVYQDELSPQEREKVLNSNRQSRLEDRQARRSVDVNYDAHNPYNPNPSKAPWPKVTVFQRADVSPKEVAAAFFSFDDQVHYLPDLKSAHVENPGAKNPLEITYVFALPFGLGQEKYTVRDTATAYGPEQYRVDWRLLNADTTLASWGSLRVEPLGNSSLIAYETFVYPGRLGSSMGWVVNGMKDAVYKTVDAIVNHVETEKTQDPMLLQNQVRNFEEALRALHN